MRNRLVCVCCRAPGLRYLDARAVYLAKLERHSAQHSALVEHMVTQATAHQQRRRQVRLWGVLGRGHGGAALPSSMQCHSTNVHFVCVCVCLRPPPSLTSAAMCRQNRIRMHLGAVAAGHPLGPFPAPAAPCPENRWGMWHRGAMAQYLSMCCRLCFLGHGSPVTLLPTDFWPVHWVVLVGCAVPWLGLGWLQLLLHTPPYPCSPCPMPRPGPVQQTKYLLPGCTEAHWGRVRVDLQLLQVAEH